MTFADIVPSAQADGFRAVAPWLRGFGQTIFRSNETMRSGEIAAMAQDAMDLAEALGGETRSALCRTGAQTDFCKHNRRADADAPRR
ncbi:alpha/beta fold hydrolase [Mesorhizobium sp. ORM6]